MLRFGIGGGVGGIYLRVCVGFCSIYWEFFVLESMMWNHEMGIFFSGLRGVLSMLVFSGWGWGVWVVFRVRVRACGEGGM